MGDKVPFIETRDEKLAGEICGGENDDKAKAARKKKIQQRATPEEKKRGLIDLQVPGGCLVGDDGKKWRDYGGAKQRDYKDVNIVNADGSETSHLVNKKTGQSERKIPLTDGIEDFDEEDPIGPVTAAPKKPKSTLDKLGDKLGALWPFGDAEQ
jgi:hypothetical protein